MDDLGLPQEIVHEGCFLHDLQTDVKHASAMGHVAYKRDPFDQGKVWWERMRKLVANFTTSTKEQLFLSDIQQELIDKGEVNRRKRIQEAKANGENIRDTKPKPLSMVTYSVTRWTGAMRLLARLMRIKSSLMEYFKRKEDMENKVHSCKMSDLRWTEVEQMSAVFYPVFITTKKMQGERYICRSYAMLFIEDIINYLEVSCTSKIQFECIETGEPRQVTISKPVVMATRDRLLSNLKDRYSLFEDNDVLSMTVDPRTLGAILQHDDGYYCETAKRLLVELVEAIIKAENRNRTGLTEANHIMSTEDADDEQTNQPFQFGQRKKRRLNGNTSQAGRVKSARESANEEVERYMASLPYVQKYGEDFDPMELLTTENPLDWLKERVAVFPHVFKVAARILSAPRTSAFQERVFSYTGLDTSKKRSSLSVKRINVRQCIKMNSSGLVHNWKEALPEIKKRVKAESSKEEINPAELIANDSVRSLVENLDKGVGIHEPTYSPPVARCIHCVYSILKNMKCDRTNAGGGSLRCDGENCCGSSENRKINIGDPFYSCLSCSNYDLCLKCYGTEVSTATPATL